MTEIHICLFPELNYDLSNNGHLFIDIYDNEDEIPERKKLAHLVKGPEDPGWNLWYTMPTIYGPREIRMGVYPYISPALQDIAYLLGQYWSPNRNEK